MRRGTRTEGPDRLRPPVANVGRIAIITFIVYAVAVALVLLLAFVATFYASVQFALVDQSRKFAAVYFISVAAIVILGYVLMSHVQTPTQTTATEPMAPVSTSLAARGD